MRENISFMTEHGLCGMRPARNVAPWTRDASRRRGARAHA
jgi:hypothetical protein